MTPTIELLAPAKVNLALEVIGRRPDGYHELATVFAALELADRLTFRNAPALRLEVAGQAPAGEDNLVLRAARSLSSQAPGRGAHIRLVKRIPAAAGLGGGSSDAAATLLGLRRLWGLGIGDAELERIGRELGADVPFFLSGASAAFATGRGDEIEPLPGVPSLPLALAVPPFRLVEKTRRVFAALGPEGYTSGERARRLVRELTAGHAPEPGALVNGLWTPACHAFPELAAYARALEAASGRPWTSTGAGPALFHVAPTETEARRAVETTAHLPGVRIVTATLG